MSFIALMDKVPIWVIFVVSLLVIILSVRLGFWIGDRERRRTPDIETSHSSTAVGAAFGLLAFILAFTFSFTTSRLDMRKHLVLEEANAVGTAYLRAGALELPVRDDARRLLERYVNDRAVLAEDINRERVLATMERSQQLHDQLWSLALTAATQNPTPITALFMSAMNDMIDLHQERITVATQQRMPSIFWMALFLLTIVTMMLAGYHAGRVGENVPPVNSSYVA